MILFDTSAWVDHFGPAPYTLTSWLQAGQVLMHPFVRGEIALGSLTRRAQTLRDLALLPQAAQASDEEVLALIEVRGLFSQGIGLVDAHLLASVLIMPGAQLGTFDKRLARIATGLGAGGLANEVML
ncbi:MAG: type II toxin-antitoxin system VapC family toxin [Hyphomonas sp.]